MQTYHMYMHFVQCTMLVESVAAGEWALPVIVQSSCAE